MLYFVERKKNEERKKKHFFRSNEKHDKIKQNSIIKPSGKRKRVARMSENALAYGFGHPAKN